MARAQRAARSRALSLSRKPPPPQGPPPPDAFFPLGAVPLHAQPLPSKPPPPPGPPPPEAFIPLSVFLRGSPPTYPPTQSPGALASPAVAAPAMASPADHLQAVPLPIGVHVEHDSTAPADASAGEDSSPRARALPGRTLADVTAPSTGSNHHAAPSVAEFSSSGPAVDSGGADAAAGGGSGPPSPSPSVGRPTQAQGGWVPR